MRTTRGESIGAAAAAAVGWRTFGLPGPATAAGPGYGPLGPPDGNGVSLPPGFEARLIGYTGRPVAGTDYLWHGEPDGAATFAIEEDGGWVLACNSEVNGSGGGVSAIRFGADGEVQTAYRILKGTKWNCAGGATPWGTWLSCEEFRNGMVWECDPMRPGQGVARKAMGVRPWSSSYNGATRWAIIDHLLVRGATPRSGDVLDFGVWSIKDEVARIEANFVNTGSDHFPVAGTADLGS